MKNKKTIILNVCIILFAAACIVLDVISGLDDTLNLITFIASCVVIVLCFIEIIIEITKNKQKNK